MITRRTFFKSLGAIVGCGAVAPSVSLERLQYLDFVPGLRLKNAVRTSVSARELVPVRFTHEFWRARTELVSWLKGRVPERFRHGRFEIVGKYFDFGNQIGVAVDYNIPVHPSALGFGRGSKFRSDPEELESKEVYYA